MPVGNSAGFAVGAAATSVSTNASGKAFTLAVGNVSSTGAAATIGGHRITGLMTTSAQVFAGQSAGGPLVNLSGQVVGIDLSGSAHGARRHQLRRPDEPGAAGGPAAQALTSHR